MATLACVSLSSLLVPLNIGKNSLEPFRLLQRYHGASISRASLKPVVNSYLYVTVVLTDLTNYNMFVNVTNNNRLLPKQRFRINFKQTKIDRHSIGYIWADVLVCNFRFDLLVCKSYHNKGKPKYNVDKRFPSHTCIRKRQLCGNLPNARIYNLIATIQALSGRYYQLNILVLFMCTVLSNRVCFYTLFVRDNFC